MCAGGAWRDVADEKLAQQLRAFDVAGFGSAEIEAFAIGQTIDYTLSFSHPSGVGQETSPALAQREQT